MPPAVSPAWRLYAWSWLRDPPAGCNVDVHSDVDHHAGIDELGDYKALILATYPEYLSEQAFSMMRARPVMAPIRVWATAATTRQQASRAEAHDR